MAELIPHVSLSNYFVGLSPNCFQRNIHSNKAIKNSKYLMRSNIKMNSEQSLTSLTENQLRDIAYKVLENAINELKQNQHSTKEWMNLKEGSIYAGVAVNTFNKFILRGLRISVIGAVKRVSKTEIDNFLNKHSY